VLAQSRTKLKWVVVQAILSSVILVAAIFLGVITVSLGALHGQIIVSLGLLLLIAGWRLARCVAAIGQLRETIRQHEAVMP
jgi:hypothetical protein